MVRIDHRDNIILSVETRKSSGETMAPRVLNLLALLSLLLYACYVVFLLGLRVVSGGGGTYWMGWRLDLSVLESRVGGTDVPVWLLVLTLPGPAVVVGGALSG